GLRGGGDEAPCEVGVDRTRADEKAAAKRQAERCLHARLQRADSLPRALDPTLDRGVEAPAAGHLEVREARLVEDLGQAELFGGRHAAGERLLSEQADSRVGEGRHGWDLTAGSQRALTMQTCSRLHRRRGLHSSPTRSRSGTRVTGSWGPAGKAARTISSDAGRRGRSRSQATAEGRGAASYA